MKLSLEPFERFNLLPLSFSRINKFVTDRTGFYISYIHNLVFKIIVRHQNHMVPVPQVKLDYFESHYLGMEMLNLPCLE